MLRITCLGELLTGYAAGMVSGGQLNPALPRWLMGFPKSWDRESPKYYAWLALTRTSDLKATGTPSSPRSLPSSSARLSSPSETADFDDEVLDWGTGSIGPAMAKLAGINEDDLL